MHPSIRPAFRTYRHRPHTLHTYKILNVFKENAYTDSNVYFYIYTWTQCIYICTSI
jgi:hypothetical protein